MTAFVFGKQNQIDTSTHPLLGNTPVLVPATPTASWPANARILSQPLHTYRGHEGTVTAVAWSPHGDHIASAGTADSSVQVWDAITGHTLFSYHGHSMAVQDLAWSPNGSTIASAADNVQLWNSLTGKQIYTYTKHATSITHEVQAVAWSPNGRYIASGGMEGTVQVWNAV